MVVWCKMHLGLETLLLSKSYTQVSLFNASLSYVCVTHTVHNFVHFSSKVNLYDFQILSLHYVHSILFFNNLMIIEAFTVMELVIEIFAL